MVHTSSADVPPYSFSIEASACENRASPSVDFAVRVARVLLGGIAIC
jgi:hypothetical protein